MTVVTDTSVLLNLCLLGQQQILPNIFGEVQATPAVVSEFIRLTHTDPRFTSLHLPDYIRVCAPTAIHPLLDTPRLHPGEREAISLAFEINASRILMDERAGRALATNLGIPCIGLLGILIQAKRLCLIPSIMPLLDRLQNEARFWIAPSLRLQILHLADETH